MVAGHYLTRRERIYYFVCQNWILLFTFLFVGFVLLPFLAPVFMHLGWAAAGKSIYLLYSFLCHQLPERSYFFFGPKVSYTLTDIQSAWVDTLNPVILRQFVGNPEMGWKVAWSDRMVSMYTTTMVAGVTWNAIHRRLRPLPWWGLLLFLMPMVVDGTSHLVSDFAGIGQGFRDQNAWLAALTNGMFSPTFYTGDALTSFNGLVRLATGVFFGVGIVWFGFPYVEQAFAAQQLFYEKKAQRIATWKQMEMDTMAQILEIARKDLQPE